MHLRIHDVANNIRDVAHDIINSIVFAIHFLQSRRREWRRRAKIIVYDSINHVSDAFRHRNRVWNIIVYRFNYVISRSSTFRLTCFTIYRSNRIGYKFTVSSAEGAPSDSSADSTAPSAVRDAEGGCDTV